MVELMIVIAIIGITAAVMFGTVAFSNGTNKTTVLQKSIFASEAIEKIISNYNKGLYVVPEEIVLNDKISFPLGSNISRKIYDVAWFISKPESRYQVEGCVYVYCSDMTGFEGYIRGLEKDSMAVEIALDGDNVVFKNICYIYKNNSCYFYKFSYEKQTNELIQCKEMDGVGVSSGNGYNLSEARAEINKIS